MLNFERIGALLEARKPGHSLPQALYNDPEVFAFDLEAIYARSWILVGFEVELPKPGSHLAMTIGLWPIVIVRDRSGKLGGFHNSCRHRGAQICPDGRGASARLVCPYHRWTYELTGELVHAGRMAEDFDRSAHGLKPIHVESVGGVIYVCLGEVAPPIDDFREKFEPLLAPHNMANAKLAYQSTLLEKANWKLVMENGRECYHCVGAHPELSASFPVAANAYFEFGEDPHVANYARRMAEVGLPMGPEAGEWWEAIRFPLNEGYVSMTIDGQPAVKKLMCETGGGDIGSLRWAVEPHRDPGDRQMAGPQGCCGGCRLRRREPHRALDRNQPSGQGSGREQSARRQCARLYARPLFPRGRDPGDQLRRLVLRPRQGLCRSKAVGRPRDQPHARPGRGLIHVRRRSDLFDVQRRRSRCGVPRGARRRPAS
jgi:Rieske 2Fe-2S family protein